MSPRIVPLALLLALAAAPFGCAATADEPTASDQSASDEEGVSTIPGYVLPWKVGRAYWVGQGEHGVVAGLSTPGNHALPSMVHAIDFELPLDTPVLAARKGHVVAVKDDVRPGHRCYDGGGEECKNENNYVLVRHDDGTDTLYLHFSRVWVHKGDKVGRRQELGRSGSTGWSSGPHLHVQRQGRCGSWFCDSLPLHYLDIGIPKAGNLPIASDAHDNRCWTTELNRYVGSVTCVQNKDSQAWWECRDGGWTSVDTCSIDAGAIYGFCQRDDGTWAPERSCETVQGPWRQCGESGRWIEGVGLLAGGTTLGGPIGACMK